MSEVAGELRRLAALLDDPHEGLATWHMACQSVWERICSATAHLVIQPVPVKDIERWWNETDLKPQTPREAFGYGVRCREGHKEMSEHDDTRRLDWLDEKLRTNVASLHSTGRYNDGSRRYAISIIDKDGVLVPCKFESTMRAAIDAAMAAEER